MNEQNKQIQKIRETLRDNENRIIMGRVPLGTKNRFFEIANENEFLKDYGMALKFLVDFYDGVIGKGTEHLEIVMSNHEERLLLLEKKVHRQEEPKLEIKMGDGSIRRTRK